MSKRFENINGKLYLDEKGDRIARKAVVKINVIGEKSIAEIQDDTCRDSPKRKREVATWREVLNDYLESTTVHGLQYFNAPDIKVGVVGKILWACTIFVCFVGLSLMVMQFLHRYNENPTNTYIKTFDAPIYQASYPAVTICPITPVSLRRRLAILENTMLPQNMSKTFALSLMKYGHHITRPYSIKSFKYMDELQAFLAANKWSVTDFLKILIPCEDLFESCWWSKERIDCGKYIFASRTSYGLCCSFNYRLESYMESQKGQPRQKPLSSADFGRWSGLELVINQEMLEDDEDDEFDFLRITDSNGIMVLVHHSMDFPGLNTNTYMLQANNELEIAVNPELIQRAEGIQHRNKENKLVPVCIPDYGNTLEYFPVYRYSNCYTNCRVKAMLEVCGCLPFIFDYISEYYGIERCGIDRLSCIQENTKLISIVKDIEKENFTCSCRTPCENMLYVGDPNTIRVEENLSRNETRRRSVVRVFMGSQTFIILVTLPAASKTYLLASIGGIFSLFLGCSFLSLVEILYFAYLLFRSSFSRKEETQPSNENSLNVRQRVY